MTSSMPPYPSSSYNYTQDPSGNVCIGTTEIPPANNTGWCTWSHLAGNNLSTIAAHKCCNGSALHIWETGNAVGCVMDWCNIDIGADETAAGFCLGQVLKSYSNICSNKPDPNAGMRRSGVDKVGLFCAILVAVGWGISGM